MNSIKFRSSCFMHFKIRQAANRAILKKHKAHIGTVQALNSKHIWNECLFSFWTWLSTQLRCVRFPWDINQSAALLSDESIDVVREGVRCQRALSTTPDTRLSFAKIIPGGSCSPCAVGLPLLAPGTLLLQLANNGASSSTSRNEREGLRLPWVGSRSRCSASDSSLAEQVGHEGAWSCAC